MTSSNKSDWKDRLRSASMKIGFQLSLTKPMIEMLSAIADNVQWDRALYQSTIAQPDNFLASTQALFKRGLIEIKSERDRKHDNDELIAGHIGLYDRHHYQLTPPGHLVVDILLLAGLLIESDAAINKKAKKA